MTGRKKLIEAALPLDAINVACKADKDRKTGTIRNLHKWFAPMPLPAWRALLFASLVDDPEDDEERARLIELIERLVESGGDPPPSAVVAEARAEIQRCWPDGPPVVLDPFCGGGSTLIEAQRLGCESVGSDLNPIPVLISKVLSDYLPGASGQGPYVADEKQLAGYTSDYSGLIADVMHHADVVGSRARDAVRELFPEEEPGVTTIAWLWCREVRCPNPACKKLAPLIDNTVLSRAPGNGASIEILFEPDLEFAIRPTDEPSLKSTVSRNGATCVHCSTPIPFADVRELARAGQLGVRQMARVVIDGSGARRYLPPRPEDAEAANIERPADLPPCPIDNGALGVRVKNYGMDDYLDLYTARQCHVLSAFATQVDRLIDEIPTEMPSAYRSALVGVLVLSVGKLAQMESTQTAWRVRRGPSKAEGAFGMQTIPMKWDFAEVNPWGGSVGDWRQIVTTAVRALPFVRPNGRGRVVMSDARDADSLVDAGRVVVASDPPYFGQIGYSDLADLLYPWLRRAGSRLVPDVVGTMRSPRRTELIAASHRHAGDESAANEYFVSGFSEVFGRLGDKQAPDVPMLIVYAAKEVGAAIDGGGAWSAMLEALISADLAVVGTWPISAPGASRLRSHGSNALSGYVVLVCRPRPADAPRITRSELAKVLRSELGRAVTRMQRMSIAPVDLAQAVIGPGMESYSRHSRVAETDGTRVDVGQALSMINRTLGEVLDEQEGELDADSRWAVTWYEQHGFKTASFGDADKLARARGISVDSLVHAGIVSSSANKVSLITRDELQSDWDPAVDAHRTAWEGVQYMINSLERGGEVEAARLYARLDSLMDPTRELAYRLFQIAEGKGSADEALAYNGLVASWSEIARLAAALPDEPSGANAPEGLF
jgi:putative DNA methylase